MKRAMILAAGRGERMGELTHHVPKPLLRVKDKYLIEHAITAIKQANIQEIVINVSYHAEQIKQALGNGAKYGVTIAYSEEVERLETGGGIVKALPLLGDQPFLVMSCDIITDYPLQQLSAFPSGLAHLVMVKNPAYHAHGDYGLEQNQLRLHASSKLTFANVGVYRRELFTGCELKHFRLTQVLNPAIAAGNITGELYQGVWHNIGTPADIQALS